MVIDIVPKGVLRLSAQTPFNVPVKNINHVVDVFEKIHQKMPSKLVMIGDGPEREKAEQQARDMGILHDVIFLGKTHEIERVLNVSDLFLLPSNTESFGLKILMDYQCQSNSTPGIIRTILTQASIICSQDLFSPVTTK